MANLQSPGSQVTVTDESFGTGSGPGTVPLIIMATGQDKLNSAGDGIAAGTLAQNAEKLFLISSQRELLQTYGLPNFNEVGGNSLNGYPLNEYGLLAAHSYLGIANRAYCLRADINLADLTPTDLPPSASPRSGTYWLDANGTDAGLFVRENDTWVKTEVFMYDDIVDSATGAPLAAPNDKKFVLVLGKVDISTEVVENQIWKQTSSGYVRLNDSVDEDLDLQYSKVWPTVSSIGQPLANGDLWISTDVAEYDVSVFSNSSGNFAIQSAPLFENTAEANGFYGVPVDGDIFVEYNYADFDPVTETVFQHAIRRHNGKSVVTVVSNFQFSTSTTMTATFSINGGSQVSITNQDSAQQAAISINQAMLAGQTTNIEARDANGSLVIVELNGNDLDIEVLSGSASIGIENGVYSNWESLVYEASTAAPTGDLEEGTLWYSADFKADVIIADNGVWKELPAPVFLQPDAPSVNGANYVWIDTDQLAEYPVIYKSDASGEWIKVDSSDQSTPNGVIFADAREEPMYPEGTVVPPLPTIGGQDTAETLDSDAPSAEAYPTGIILFNTRYGSRVVKEWKLDVAYKGTTVAPLEPRWTLKSGTSFDGSLISGNDAVKQVVIEAMASTIVSNDDIRAESVFFNLIAAPGFPELMDEMVGLNLDRKETGFVLGDTPFSLNPSGTTLQAWGSNANVVPSNGDAGIVTADVNLGVFYPSGLSTNLDGNEVVVPPSHMELRQFAYNDQVAYPWFAPAGLQRGVIQNATSVGYVDEEGEYVPISLGEGQRDILYLNNINPIRTIPNSGIVNWGQKTRGPISTSALSRINVARLLNFMRYQLDVIVQPFLFEPNDAQTRGNVKTVIDSFMSELVTLRGVTDFAVVCDSSNNTGSRIDRNELWIDIAVVPTKAIEFIYVPIRIKSTGGI